MFARLGYNCEGIAAPAFGVAALAAYGGFLAMTPEIATPHGPGLAMTTWVRLCEERSDEAISDTKSDKEDKFDQRTK